MEVYFSSTEKLEKIYELSFELRSITKDEFKCSGVIQPKYE